MNRSVRLLSAATAMALVLSAAICVADTTAPPPPSVPDFIAALKDGKNQAVTAYGTGFGYDWQTPVARELAKRFGDRCRLIVGTCTQYHGSKDCQMDFSEDRQLFHPEAAFWDCSYKDAVNRFPVDQAKQVIEWAASEMRMRQPAGQLILLITWPPDAQSLKNAPDYRKYVDMYYQVAAEQHLPIIDCTAISWNAPDLGTPLTTGFLGMQWPDDRWVASTIVPRIVTGLGLDKIPAVRPASGLKTAPTKPGANGLRFEANLAAGQPQLLVALGTSLTMLNSWNMSLADRFSKAFKGRLLYKDAGMSGQSSIWGLSICPYIARMHPDAVLIEYSMNDAHPLSKLTRADALKNLDTIISTIKAENPVCDIILQTMDATGVGGGRPDLAGYYQDYCDYGKRNGIIVVDHYTQWKKLLDSDPDGYKTLVPDGVHPNADAGIKVMMPDFEATLFTGTP